MIAPVAKGGLTVKRVCNMIHETCHMLTKRFAIWLADDESEERLHPARAGKPVAPTTRSFTDGHQWITVNQFTC